jgi:hypothetical protein
VGQDADPEKEVQPKAGDVTVCLYCAEILVFTSALRLRKPNYRELTKLQLSPAWPLLERVRKASRAVQQDADFAKRQKRSTV